MSGIFGIYHSDGSPVNRNHLLRMALSIKHRGPDGTNIVHKNHIALGHSMLRTTPESYSEKLPFTHTQSGLTITADARIDNREDLARKIHLSNITNIPDSQLILHAYQKWGVDCFTHLLGDFSFVIWDSNNHRLICARDYIGIKPFYYHQSRSRFLFSSEIKQIATYPDIPLTVNEELIGEYLAFSFCSKSDTLFKNIKRLPPGHYLIVEPDNRKTIKQYWSWKPEKRIWYRETSEYAEHFLEIFERSVQSRLRCKEQVCAELSGGLDSSTIVGMASQLLKKEGGGQLHTFSLLYPGLPFDEKSFIDAVIKKHNCAAKFIKINNYLFSSWQSQVTDTFEPPDFPNLAVNNPLLSSIKKNNFRVILSGIGGDECFSGSGYPFLDYLKKGQLLHLLREVRYQGSLDFIKTVKKLGLTLTWPLIPHTIRKSLTKQTAKKQIPEWLSSRFIQDTNLIQKTHKTDPRLNVSNLGRSRHNYLFTSAEEQFFIEALDRHRAFWQTENRYPFLDQRIIEFAISIPDYINQNKKQNKYILRNKRLPLLPTVVQKRSDKADLSFLFNQVFIHSLFLLNIKKFSIGNQGWIDLKRLSQEISKKQHVIGYDQYSSGNKTWELWFAFSIEVWHNSIITRYNRGENMDSTKKENTINKPQTQSSTKSSYHKPVLHKYGSITTLTAGFGGSKVDTSGPGPGHP